MSKISILDCTLRDGGYVNNWTFGKEAIAGITKGLEEAGVDIFELGFLRNEPKNVDRTAFSTINDVNELIKVKKPDTLYTAMVEAFNPYNLENLTPYIEGGVDIIRVCIWKRLMDEHLDYAKQIIDKGYTINIQPSRVEQYNKEEFIELIKRSNDLHPFAFYIVDTWGTQSSTQIQQYAELAERYLDKDIRIGYHGHNNKMQALSCAEKFLTMGLTHDLCVDASLRGMGRGAGNLCTEVIMDYLNEVHGMSYNVFKAVDTYRDFVDPIYKEHPWGYSLYYYLASAIGVNPNFPTFFSENNYSIETFERFLDSLSEQEKIVFSPSFVENRLNELKLK